MVPYRLMYRLGLAPWEHRPVPETWRRLLGAPGAPAPGRALDVGCGTGRDAVHLAGIGWQVTAVEAVERALAKARERATQRGVDVQWVHGDAGQLRALGLEPGYALLYDFGCIQGLSDHARRGAADGLTALAEQDAWLLLFAFRPSRRRALLPRGMDEEEVSQLLGDGWMLQGVQPAADPSMPARVRRAGPTLYRLTRRAAV